MNENILLVLGIVEGRKFPRRVNQQLLVEAKFDGEILTTDIIPHENTPQFQTELAWEIDKKSLHQHRLQRTPIKVQVYTIAKSTSAKELVGYCVLDLRTAQQDGKKKVGWHTLLSSKYQSMKPELKVVLTIESDTVKEETKAAEKASTKSPIIMNEQFNDHLDVVLDNQRGYYIIGPEINACQVYVLSISIGGAQNLMKLLTNTSELHVENGFYIYYSLFDNDVTNETFYDLIEPNIPTERATVRLYTTPKRLENYFKKKKHLQVFLCSGSSTLGQTTVPLSPLYTVGDALPSTIEGLFTLTNNNTTLSPEENAVIGVSIILSMENHMNNMSPVLSKPNPEGILTSRYQQNENIDNSVNNISKLKEISPKEELNDNLPRGKLKKDNNNINSPPEKSPTKKEVEGKTEGLRMKKTEDANHHFIYSIDLRSISNISMEHPLQCVCRYVYPFFGSSSPVMTNPPVQVQRHSEVLIPQSFCKFEFASTIQLLQSTFSRVPLIIEIWNKGLNTKDHLVGIAQVHLSSVFFAEKKTTNGPLVKSEKVHIVSSERPNQKLGELHVVLGIEDRGAIKKSIQNIVHQSQSCSELSEPSHSTTVQPQPQAPPALPRETQEYQVAMALELWRQKQEEHFQQELSNKENERMIALSEEWKQRDLEREMLLKKKLEEYNMLETKLRNSMVDLEKREKQIISRENELQQKQRRFEEEFERKTIEMREASRRVKEEYEHQLHLEQLKTSDLEERNKKTLKLFNDIELKLQDRENEIYSLKENMLSRPEVKLQSEMNLLLLEKNEVDRKLEASTKSKIHYKQQWGRALRELARIKLNEQEAAKVRLKKQQHELDHMKLRYLAMEEKQVMKTDKEELNDVKDEISRKLDEIITFKETNQPNENNSKPIEQKEESQQQTQNKSQIAKLIEERDTLLQTGVYSLDDRVIEEIDKEIQSLISNTHNL